MCSSLPWQTARMSCCGRAALERKYSLGCCYWEAPKTAVVSSPHLHQPLKWHLAAWQSAALCSSSRICCTISQGTQLGFPAVGNSSWCRGQGCLSLIPTELFCDSAMLGAGWSRTHLWQPRHTAKPWGSAGCTEPAAPFSHRHWLSPWAHPELSLSRQGTGSSSSTCPSQSSQTSMKIEIYYAKNYPSAMGVESNLIRVSLLYSAEECKLHKLKSVCLWLTNGSACNTRHKQQASLQA